MKVRGVELPWRTGPGWYCHYRNGLPGGQLIGPLSTNYQAAKDAASAWNKPGSMGVFEVTQADIEAES